MDGRDDPTPLASLKTLEKLWFDDADVVFRAGEAKFKVYRGILSAHSKVFRDMFTTAQSLRDESTDGNGETTATGTASESMVPFKVFDLQDNPNDLRPFFLVMFDPSYSTSNASIHAIVSILRIAHKYDVPLLIRQAIVRLDQLYPLDKEGLLHATRKYKGPSTEDIDHRRIGSLLDTLMLALTTSCPWIIPSVLYALVSRYNVTDIMEHPKFVQLPTELHVNFVKVRVQYALESDNENSWVWTLPSGKCTNRTQCRAIAKSVQTMLLGDPGRVMGSSRKFTVDLKRGEDKLMFCVECQAAGEKYQKELEELYWHQYPVACGFEGWHVLKKMRSQWFKEK